ncbi:MAG: PrsW family intramembrane metalloprotease [Chloroflexota bacterium]
MQFIALAIATLVPLIVLIVIRALDLYQTGEFRSVVLCFVWGGIAFALAYYINRYIYFRGIATYSEIVRYFAPFAEEILKALILVYLVRRPRFTYFVDGAIYGFAAGIGFAVFENYQYVLQNPGEGLGTAVARVLSVNLVHASATALVGVALGLARFRRTAGHFGLLFGGLAAAMLLHGFFNNVNDRQIPGPILLYSAVIGLLAVGLIAFFIFRGLAEQKAWIEETLGMADRVTAQEAKVVQRMEDVGELLKPLRQIYGDDKTDQIEKFITLQAQLGIKRKTLEKLPDEKMRQAVEKDMDKLRADMNQARQAVGPYIMFSVRRLFPPDDSPLYDLLNTRLQERLAAQPAAASGKAWGAAFGQRLAQKPAAPPSEPPAPAENPPAGENSSS